MLEDEHKTVTVIYYNDDSLVLLHKVCTFPVDAEGNVVIDHAFKEGKSIVDICEGEVDILNKVGERILPPDDVE